MTVSANEFNEQFEGALSKENEAEQRVIKEVLRGAANLWKTCE